MAPAQGKPVHQNSVVCLFDCPLFPAHAASASGHSGEMTTARRFLQNTGPFGQVQDLECLRCSAGFHRGELIQDSRPAPGSGLVEFKIAGVSVVVCAGSEQEERLIEDDPIDQHGALPMKDVWFALPSAGSAWQRRSRFPKQDFCANWNCSSSLLPALRTHHCLQRWHTCCWLPMEAAQQPKRRLT